MFWQIFWQIFFDEFFDECFDEFWIFGRFSLTYNLLTIASFRIGVPSILFLNLNLSMISSSCEFKEMLICVFESHQKPKNFNFLRSTFSGKIIVFIKIMFSKYSETRLLLINIKNTEKFVGRKGQSNWWCINHASKFTQHKFISTSFFCFVFVNIFFLI